MADDQKAAVEALINGVELEWGAEEEGVYAYADVPFGNYGVEHECGKIWAEFNRASIGAGDIMQEAKALCLEDYRNRLRKALGVDR